MIKRTLFLVILGCMISVASINAQVKITGKVSDERGVGLPGANVVLLNSNIGTATDVNGNYFLTLPSNKNSITIEARFVGYKSQRKEIQVESKNIELDFQLNYDILEMEALVVTGTADPKQKKNLGNSIGLVSGNELEGKGTQLDAALSGKVAGAMVQTNSGTPGGGTSVRLRGTSSISRSAEPLYIIDGVVVDNSSD